MRSDLVVDVLPTEKIRPQASDSPVQVVDLVELFPVGAVAALDAAVELRRARRQDEQGKVSLLTEDLEVSLEFGAAVDLERPHHVGCALQDRVQELSCRVG